APWCGRCAMVGRRADGADRGTGDPFLHPARPGFERSSAGIAAPGQPADGRQHLRCPADAQRYRPAAFGMAGTHLSGAGPGPYRTPAALASSEDLDRPAALVIAPVLRLAGTGDDRHGAVARRLAGRL